MRDCLLARDVLARLPVEAPEGRDAAEWAAMRTGLEARPLRKIYVDLEVATRPTPAARPRSRRVTRHGTPWLPGVPGTGALFAGGGTRG
jgi:hypothetical protein